MEPVAGCSCPIISRKSVVFRPRGVHLRPAGAGLEAVGEERDGAAGGSREVLAGHVGAADGHRLVDVLLKL